MPENTRISSTEVFYQQYELQLNTLKDDFLRQTNWQKYCLENNIDHLVGHIRLNQFEADFTAKVDKLHAFIQENFRYFNANKVSSLLAMPSQSLDANELIFHRIWLGSNLPDIAIKSINQWNHAFAVVDNDLGLKYHNVVWVWDLDQLSNDKEFEVTSVAEDYLIGYYNTNKYKTLVKSLKLLMQNYPEIDSEFMQQLNAKRYFVDLSDYFREFLLHEFGGIYVDADTVPYRAATVFLAKPEVPDYYVYKTSSVTGEIEKIHVNWLNLLYDENGMQIAKKGNSALARIISNMNENISQLDKNIPDRSNLEKFRAYQLLVHDATYGEWQSQIGGSFIAYTDIVTKGYLVALSKQPETALLGLYGMRIIYDPVNNMKLPLNKFEQECYSNCIKRLEACNWALKNPLQLQSFAPVTFIDEFIRIAYHPQLRTAIYEYNYYSFMSHDNKLDQVNNLFSAFFIEVNAEAINHPHYWARMNGERSDYYLELPYELPIAEQANKSPEQKQRSILPKELRFINGIGLTEQHKNQIAELLFETSYLEYCSYANKLKLPQVKLQRIQNVDPMVDYCNALIDMKSNLVAYFIGLKVSDLNQIKFVSYYRDEMKAMDDAYDEFISRNTQADDYFVVSLAIDTKYRGFGYFNTIFNEIIQHAQDNKSPRIILTVWASNSALQIYLKKGFRTVDVFDYAYNIFFDKLYLLEYNDF